MPANLPAEAKSKWRKVMEAKTPEEKLAALKEFMSAIPKHKGTEKLRMQITRQMASLRREIELRKRKKAGRGEQFFVEKVGDIQVVLLGFPNSGKTTFLKCITGANVRSNLSPFSTKKPQPGVAIWKGVYFQLIDTPSIMEGASKGAFEGNRVLALAKNADAILLVIDATVDPLYQFEILRKELEESRISLTKPRAIVKIERKRHGGIVIIGNLENTTQQEVISLLREYGIYHAIVTIEGSATLDAIEEAIFGSINYKPTAIILTKVDQGISKEICEKFARKVHPIPVFLFSEKTCKSFSFDRVAEYIFASLDLIKVYTRNPRTGKVEEKPVVVKRGTKVIEIAKIIHSQLYRNFKYAKVWSTRFKFNPQKVGKDFVPEDNDIVEIVS
ncbi:MAG: GTP-binding protein [Thermoprotei archaeon]|nr:MAG: GTP-binding protein [Thermoprotei archaeon]